MNARNTLIGVSVALAMGVATGASAGITGSKHDLGGGFGQLPAGGQNGEICVFCHTPHGADTTAPVPLWNKKITPATYTVYAPGSTTEGEILANTTIATGPSMACMTCHDGTQAMDNILNSSGTGGYSATGGTGTTVMTGAVVPVVGPDLSNDHPIGIQYAGGGCEAATVDGNTCGGTGATVPSNDPDFKLAVRGTLGSGTAVWWVDVDSAPTIRSKYDLPLYTRTFPTTSTTGPSVECATCHDPHNGDSFPVAFLRVNNATGTVANGPAGTGVGSGLCLTCHDK